MIKEFPTLRHIRDEQNLKGKRVLVRCDFNVPLGADGVVDENEAWRIEKALPTIIFLRGQGARIILISHLGRAKDESLAPVADFFNTVYGLPVSFVPAITGASVTEKIEEMKDGEILMLENLRSNDGENENTKSFAKELAAYGDIYVMEAFSNAHRDHASMVTVPKLLPTFIGFQFFDELENLSLVLQPERPFVMIVGGAKFETKLPMIKKMVALADIVLVGGALAHTFFKYRGLEIGKSLLEENSAVKELLMNPRIIVPDDVVIEAPNKVPFVVRADNVPPDGRIVDIGPASVSALAKTIQEAKTIVWNGPLGYYEGGYVAGTKQLLDLITESSAKSIIGGGDTVFVLRQNNMMDKVTFVSTAGGAMLDFLTNGTLPAIEALL